MTPGGFLNVLKPPGMTSHDVVRFLRKTAKIRQVGHTGTLDPGAAGVLVAGIGPATKLIQFLPKQKRYRAEITFGWATDTQDASGEVIEETRDCLVTEKAFLQVLPRFLGEINQVPPMVSAVKHHGKRLYELARQGITTERKARRVQIFHIEIMEVSRRFPLRFGDKLILDIKCSGGTYIRTLCHDLGQTLGCHAHMSFLVRVEEGVFHLSGSHTLEEIGHTAQNGELVRLLIEPNTALAHLPGVEVDRDGLEKVLHGNRLPLSRFGRESPGFFTQGFTVPAAQPPLVRVTHAGRLLAVARLDDEWVQPVKVLES